MVFGSACEPKPASIALEAFPTVIDSMKTVQLPPPTVLDAKGTKIERPHAFEIRADPPGVAVVEGDRITAIRNGTTSLVIRLKGTPVEVRHPLDVELIDRVEISCSSTPCKVRSGASIRLTARAFSRDKPVHDAALKWSSSDASIVEVVSPGEVKATAVGRVEVTVAFESLSASTTVHAYAPADEVVVRCPASRLKKRDSGDVCTAPFGEAIVLTAEVLGQGAPVPEAEVAWSSKDVEILKPMSSGRYFGRGVGKSEIIARSGDATGVLELEVIEEVCTKRQWQPVGYTRDRRVIRCRARDAFRCFDDRFREMSLDRILEECCCEIDDR